MAKQKKDSTEEVLIAAPVIALQEIGGVFWNFLREVGSMFWFIVHTFEETIERLRDGRVPFRAISFFRHAERAGVESCFCLAIVEGKLPQFRKPKKRFLLAGARPKRGLIVRSAKIMAGRCFLICGLAAIAALAHAQQFGRMSSMKENKIGLVVHGGAGTMERGKMTPEREREYRRGSKKGLRGGLAI